MKIRKGFVSNSSSSSFIIGVKGKLTEDKILRSFKVDSISPIFYMVKDMARLMAKSEKKEIEPSEIENLFSIEKKILEKGFDLYVGSASDDSYEYADILLCSLEIDYEDDEIIIYKESGY